MTVNELIEALEAVADEIRDTGFGDTEIRVVAHNASITGADIAEVVLDGNGYAYIFAE